MLQAEIGSARIVMPESLPTPGHLMADFILPSSDGKHISIYDYRGRSNLVLFFAGRPQDPAEQNLLSDLKQHYSQIRDADSEAVAILASTVSTAAESRRNMLLPFPVLADADLHVHHGMGALGTQGVPAPALYITDRFLEIYAAWRTGAGDHLPAVSEVLSWLAFLDSQCPECTQLEWPVDD